jgi:hypothetical protein
LVTAILFVFVAPSLDLAPSALRGLRLALVVLICLRLLEYQLPVDFSGRSLPCGIAGRNGVNGNRSNPESDLLDLYCARLC